MSEPAKLPVSFLLPYGPKLIEGLIQPSRRHKEREYSQCLPVVMRPSLCLPVVILLPQIGYPICMWHIARL